ncbi:hypothetical protein BU17DRAFT_82968 [Hysterangium stoloniferum]|nr:hypothetical protein BU17DRAFT_82968 [Hysterangium stoloniferum]
MAGIIFQDLPDELIIKILQALDVRGVLCTASTCHILHEIVQHSLILQYKIQLFAYGLEDTGSNSKLSLAAKSSEARTLTQNWACLQFREKETIDVPWGALTLTVGDVSSYGIRKDPDHRTMTRMRFIRHRSIAHDYNTTDWTTPHLGMEIDYLTHDPSQNLVAAVVHLPAQQLGSPSLEHEIRLLTMDTSVSHPRADHDTLRCTPHFNTARHNRYLIQINQDYLALFICHSSNEVHNKPEIFIWNWRTGKLVIVTSTLSQDYRCSSMELDFQMMSFALISPRHFAVTKVSTSGMRPPTIEVYDFHLPQSDQSKSPKLVRSFQLPVLVSGIDIIKAQINIRTYSSGKYETLRPFRPDPLYRLLTVSIILGRGAGLDIDTREYQIFMMQSTLLDMAFQSNTLIPWKVWGPSRTRLLEVPRQRQFFGVAFAARYASVEEPNPNIGMVDAWPPPRRLVVMDFHPIRCRGADDGIFSGELPWSIESYPASSPTVISDRQWWHSDILTTLPYREVISQQTHNYDGICISDECVIGIRPFSAAYRGRHSQEVDILYF